MRNFWPIKARFIDFIQLIFLSFDSLFFLLTPRNYFHRKDRMVMAKNILIAKKGLTNLMNIKNLRTSCRLFSHLPHGLYSTTSSTSSSLSSPECSFWISITPSARLLAIFVFTTQRYNTSETTFTRTWPEERKERANKRKSRRLGTGQNGTRDGSCSGMVSINPGWRW